MKTIEEAAKSHEFNRDINGSLINKATISSFKAGAKFAHRWISVEEELPNTEDEANGLSKVCICKSNELADEVSAYYDEYAENWKIYPLGVMIGGVTHWRPIELK